MYSDMSMRTIASWLSNMNSASARASSVLPTPVGPRKRNTPMGRSGSASPARDDLGDVLSVDLLLEEAGLARLGVGGLGLGDAALEVGDLAVAQLGGALEVALARSLVELAARLLQPLLDHGNLVDGVL